MNPFVTFPDPEAAVIGYLNAAFVGNLAARKPSTIQTGAPSAGLGSATHVQVEMDASFTQDWPATDRATVRVTVHAGAGHRSDVKSLASLVQGLLAIHPGDDDVYGTQLLVGRSGVIVDPSTKNLMVWFTVRVNLRPIPVSA